MLEKVKQTIEKYNLVIPEDKIVVGVSGGPDSMCLLNILLTLQYSICVAHINHGLRESAMMDEQFVREFCMQNQIPFFSKTVRLSEIKNGMTLEEAGRRERYQFFSEIKQQENATKIATAHNCNDNAETILMNLIRGTGLSGLTGMEMVRGDIIRPLLECTRKEIEEYCEENNLMPRQDETNIETIYTRNKIRLELIPYIEKYMNENIISTLNRTAKILSEEERFLVNETEKVYGECVIQEFEGKLECNLKKFNTLDIVLKRRLIINFIIKVIGNVKDIEKVHIDDIMKLCENNVGGKFLTPNKNIKFSILRGKLTVEKLN